MREKSTFYILIGVGFCSLVWIEETSACDLNDKNDVNILETFVNKSIPEKHIQRKLYSLFNQLEEAHLNGEYSNSTAGVNFMFMLMYPKSSQSILLKKGSRKRRDVDCKELERESEKEFEGLRAEMNKLREGFENRRKFFSEGVCDSQCKRLCSKFECSHLCPFLPGEPTCADPLPCPKGCSAHWLPQKTNITIKNHSVKSRIGQKINIWQKINKGMAYLDRDFRGLKRYQYLNETGLLEEAHNKSKFFESISKAFLSKSIISDLLEILDYFKEDVTPSMNGTLVPYSTATDILIRNNRIIEKTIKAIIGHIIPPTTKCKEISNELSKSKSAEGMFQDVSRKIEEKLFVAEEIEMEKSCKCEERCAKEKLAMKVIDCSYNCPNNEYPCRGYHCRCIFTNRYYFRKAID